MCCVDQISEHFPTCFFIMQSKVIYYVVFIAQAHVIFV